MATKKQKREALIAKREKFEAEVREIGRKALEADRKRREIENRERWEKTHDKSHHKFVDECPICTQIKKEQRRKNAAQGVHKVVRGTQRRMPPPSVEEGAIDLTRKTADV